MGEVVGEVGDVVDFFVGCGFDFVVGYGGFMGEVYYFCLKVELL